MAYNTFNPIVYKGLVLYLDAENLKSYSGSGLNWYDLTSNGNNGVLTNGATFSLSGNSIQFDGVDDYVNTNIFTLKSIVSRPCSLSFWFRTNINSNVRQVIIADWDSGGSFETTRLEISGYGITLGKVGGTLVNIYGGDDGLVESTTTIQTNTWYNVVIQCPTNSSTELYLNGVLESSASSNEGIVGSGRLALGRAGSVDDLYLSGNISQCLLYNRSLTPVEVLQNYNATKWRFMNELPSIVTDQLVLNLDASDPSSYPGSGTSWYDLTANSHNGTLTNGAYYDPSDSGVMIFDGINDYVNVGSLGSGFGSFTLDMWFNSGSVTDYKNIIDFNGWNTGLRIEQYSSPGYYLNWPNNGYSRARMAIIINITDGFFGFGADCPGVITDNTWYNLVVTFDGDYCSIYINNEKLVDNYLVPSGFVGYINNMRIGDGFDYSSRRFQGKIPVVRIYDKALIPSEVLQNFNAQKNRYGL